MVGERLQSRRPFSSPILEMVARETPVPEKDPQPVFPMSVISASDTQEAIENDVMGAFMDTEGIDTDSDIQVSTDISFRRGLGEFTDYNIFVNVDGARPGQVDDAVEQLVEKGYLFSSVQFK